MLVLFRAGYGELGWTIMVDGWARSVATQPNSFSYWGYVPLVGVSPGQTVLRSWWNISVGATFGDSAAYPPGASVLRAGIAYVSEADTLGLKPTPVSNADADWMAITSIPPHSVSLNQTTAGNTWNFEWNMGIDKSIKSQRKNTTTENHFLWLAWEFSLKETIVGFEGFQWWGTLDAYLRTPDA